MAKEKQRRPPRSHEELDALKPKFFEAIDAGLTLNAAAASVDVHPDVTKKWLQQRETGAVPTHVARAERTQAMLAHLAQHGAEATAKKFGVTVGAVYMQKSYAKKRGNWPPAKASGSNGHARPAEPVAAPDQLNWEAVMAYADKHGSEKAIAHYELAKTTFYKKKRELRGPGAQPNGKNGHAKPGEAARAVLDRADLAAREVSTTRAIFGATSQILQILEPLSDADRHKVASSILTLVQGGIG